MKVITLFVLVALAASAYGYTTSGNKIIDPNGNPILLRGICRCSTEWTATGENISNADWNLMKSWGANVIRITMNQCFWNSNTNGYQAFMDSQINYIISQGMGVILDLHWSDQGGIAACGQQTMPDSNSVIFWKSVASKYKSNKWIIFELYNEPHDVAWSIWLNGGSAGGFTTPGFQSLLNTVRNDAGAPNAVIINGLNYAYDLSGVSSNPVSGTNIIYGTHPYDYSGKQLSDYPSSFGYLFPTYPVIATEFGNFDCSSTYYTNFLTYANQNDMSWTSWAWYVSGCSFPSIISDWSGTPTASGQLVKTQLQTGPKVPSGTSTSTTAPATTTAAPATTTTKSSGTTTTTKSAGTTTTTKSAGTTTTKAPTTTKAGSSGVKITANVNNGTNQYWMHIDSFTNSNKVATACSFLDSASGGSYTVGTTETWGPGWTWSPGRIINPPVTLEVTASDGTVLVLTNVVTSLAPGAYLSNTNF